MPPRHPSRLLHLLPMVAVVTIAAGSHALADATIVINNMDPPGVGLNDPTPVDPTGKNPGETLGEQRRIVFQFAADLWGSMLGSDAEIVVQATFRSLPCSEGSGLLASAGSVRIMANFPGAPFEDTWYPPALANKLAGYDLTPGAPDPSLLGEPFNDDLYLIANVALDDDPICLGGAGWYYGLDNKAGSRVDLVNVVMHEIAHGLGFANFVDEATGTGPSGFTDAFSRHTFDDALGLHWNEMTDEERATSATRAGAVVWDGPHVRAEAPNVLGPAPLLELIDPAEGTLPFEVTTATFGPALPAEGLAGEIVIASDFVGASSDACDELPGDHYNDTIVLVDRGSCSFTDKVANAQRAGAAAVVVVNDQLTGLPPMTGQDPTIVIPAVGLSWSDGQRVKMAIPGAQGAIRYDPTRLAGTDSSQNVRLFAGVTGGSAISHWDLTVSPSLLMEPVFQPDLKSIETVDLTSRVLADIGWDECPESDFSADATIGDCDPGVANRVLHDGCTIMDRIELCRLGASFDRKCIDALARALFRDDVIEARDRNEMRQCVKPGKPKDDRPPRGGSKR